MKKIIISLFFTFVGITTIVTGQNNPAPFVNTNLTRGEHLRVLRLAVSCTWEYTQSVGGMEAAKANLTAWLAEINLIYGREYSVRFELIPNNDMLIFTDPTMDPWLTMPAGAGCQNNALILDNQPAVIDGIIGDANYDISHVILGPQFGGGCAGGFKTGYSGGFDLGVTRHEIGHQFSQAHTINNGGNNNYEILGGNWSIQGGNGQSFAHSVSFHELAVHLNTTEQASGTKVPTGNTIPTIDAGPDRVIPISTPFTLSAVSIDPDAGDQLSYAWDQLDGGIEQGSPVADDSQGALFMRFAPGPQSSRTFPQMADLLQGNYKTAQENLPTQAREINVRVTVNDNHKFNYNGTLVPASGINSDDVKITVADTGGPFQVSSPNTPVTFAGGAMQTISWLVNGTDQAPINTADVKISLSTDGGVSFPIVLAESTPNDGTHSVTMPNIATSQARIKVEALGNIYFDISNQNFTITQVPGLPGLLTTITDGSTIVSENGQSDTYNLSLLTAPVGTVTVLLAADPQTELSLDGVTFSNAATVAFSNTNPQVIHVRGKYDLITEGPHTGSISQVVITSSDNINYPVGLPGSAVAVAISDAQIPPVVGIDFDSPASTSVPDQWIKFVGMNNQTASNIPLDDGTPTGIDISITDSSPGQSFDFSHNSGTNTARHAQALDQTLGGVSVSQGTVQVTWSGLKANTKYRVFVFAHNVVNGPTNQMVTIVGNGTDNPPPFTQVVGGAIQVNDQTSTNQPLLNFAKEVSASAAGSIVITIDAPGEIWLSGLAIQEVLSTPAGGGCPTDELVVVPTLNQNILASSSITTQGAVSASGAVYSAPDVNINANFEVPAGQCFEVNNIGCAYTGTIECMAAGGNGNMPDGTCSAPYVLSCGTPFTGNTTNGMSNWSGYPNGTDYDNNEVIHTLVVPAMTTTIISMTGFNNDMDFFVSSTCNNTTVISGDGAVNGDGADESVTIMNTTAAAITYFIIVEGYLGVTGPYTLTCN